MKKFIPVLILSFILGAIGLWLDLIWVGDAFSTLRIAFFLMPSIYLIANKK